MLLGGARRWALVASCCALFACRAVLGIGDLPSGDGGSGVDGAVSDGAASDGAATSTVIAQNQQSPVAIAVDSINVYWINASGAVLYCPKTGCTADHWFHLVRPKPVCFLHDTHCSFHARRDALCAAA